MRVILVQVAMQPCEYNWNFFALLLGAREFQLGAPFEEILHNHCTFPDTQGFVETALLSITRILGSCLHSLQELLKAIRLNSCSSLHSPCIGLLGLHFPGDEHVEIDFPYGQPCG